MKQHEINRQKSRQRILNVIDKMKEGHDYSSACAALGYRKDATSRAKQNFIRMGDKYIEDAFREEFSLNDTQREFFVKVALGQDVGKSSRGRIDFARQQVRKFGLVKVLRNPRRWVLTDDGVEYYGRVYGWSK